MVKRDLLDVANPTVGEFTAYKIGRKRAESTDEEEKRKPVIDLTFRELTRWADDTPNDASSTKHFCGRTDKSILLVGFANTRNVAEHPRLDTKLDSTSNDGCHNLRPEHRSGRNFHVMAKFKVRGERQSLSHSDITPGLEHHHSDRSSRKTVTNNQFGDNIEADLLVSDGLNHSYGNDIKKGNNESKDEPWNGELGRPALDDSNTESKHGHWRGETSWA